MNWLVRFVEWIAGLPDTDKVALIALSGVLISALIAFISAGHSLYINSVTVERSKWINALRTNISDFSKLIRTFHYKTNYENLSLTSPENTKYIEELHGLIALIKLQLNPKGSFDSNIITILGQMPSKAQSKSDLDVLRMDDLLIAHCQWLMKAEWERVKLEASGPLRRVRDWGQAKGSRLAI